MQTFLQSNYDLFAEVLPPNVAEDCAKFLGTKTNLNTVTNYAAVLNGIYATLRHCAPHNLANWENAKKVAANTTSGIVRYAALRGLPCPEGVSTEHRMQYRMAKEMRDFVGEETGKYLKPSAAGRRYWGVFHTEQYPKKTKIKTWVFFVGLALVGLGTFALLELIK